MLSGFLTIALLHSLALISPGPDYALITKTALMSSRRHALWVAFGIAIGIWFHVLYCLFGIAVLIAQSPMAYNSVRYLGAAYLIYLGIHSFRARVESAPLEGEKKMSPNDLIAFRQGILCNILNPKATLFFLSVFTLIVDPQTPLWLQSVYGLQMSIMTFAWFGLLAVMISHPRFKQILTRWQAHIGKIMGILFLLFAAHLIFIL